MAILEGQKVEIKWSGSNKKHYESIKNENGDRKYIWSGRGNIFLVEVKDLPKGNQSIISVRCDYCNKVIDKINMAYQREIENNNNHGVHKDCCKKCTPLKMREIYGTLDELEFQEKDICDDNTYSKDDLIKYFFKYKEEFGKYPKKIDIDGTEGYPSAEVYIRNWESWNKFLLEIGVIGEFGYYKEDENIIKKMYPHLKYTIRDINEKLIEKRSVYDMQKIIKKMDLNERNLFIKRDYDKNLKSLELFYISLKDLEQDIGKCPTAIDYDEYTKLNKLPGRRKAEKELGKPFGEICKDLFGQTNKIVKTEEMLLNELRELKYKLGRTPKANELKIHGLAEQKAYRRRFNMTYQELIESLGWELSSPKLRFKTEEEMLADYERLFNEIGRLPNNFDLRDCEYISSYQTYRDKFSTLKNVWDILELPYDLNQDISAGYVCLNKNNEICRSNAELEISNILYDNNVNYIPEIKYSDLDTTLNNKWIMDWYLKDCDIYVEYFGMYQETQLKRSTRIGRYSRKVKKKINYCVNNNIRLIDLYPSDLKDDHKGLHRKFLENGINLNVL